MSDVDEDCFRIGMGKVILLYWEQRDKVLDDPAVLLMVAKELLLDDETLLLPADPPPLILLFRLFLFMDDKVLPSSLEKADRRILGV